MVFEVLTLFPGMFHGVIGGSILGRATAAGHLDVRLRDFREFGEGTHRKVDDTPYGGGPGMVLKPGPVVRAVKASLAGNWPGDPDPSAELEPTRLVLLTPQGRRFDQAVAREFAAERRILLLCGHYEGFDERIRQSFEWDEVSLGDFVMTGGEIAALAVIDATTRLLPGVLGDGDSTSSESFEDGLLEYPQYTRPAEFEGMGIPPILVSGHHAEIAKWRHQLALERTKAKRPDLYEAWREKHPEPTGGKGRKKRRDVAGESRERIEKRSDDAPERQARDSGDSVPSAPVERTEP